MTKTTFLGGGGFTSSKRHIKRGNYTENTRILQTVIKIGELKGKVGTDLKPPST